MLHPARLVSLLLVLLVCGLHADTSLESARRAQAMLGSEVWSKVILIHNETRDGHYPRTLHALVFELAGILWFYTDVEGTQSFSLYRGRLEEEKANFGPLLRELEPGFVRWSSLEEMPRAAESGAAPLRNGCFIESVAALHQRAARGLPIVEPRLLSYYVETIQGRSGHTVLTYRVGDTIEIVDPGRPGERLVFASAMGNNPLVLARAIDEHDVRKARYLAVETDPAVSGRVAASSGPLSKTVRESRG